jgi:hypothetical protein
LKPNARPLREAVAGFCLDEGPKFNVDFVLVQNSVLGICKESRQVKVRNKISVSVFSFFMFLFCNPIVVFAAAENKKISSESFKTNFEEHVQFISKFEMQYTLTSSGKSACVLKLGKIAPFLSVKFKPNLKKDAESLRYYNLEKKMANGYLKISLNKLMSIFIKKAIQSIKEEYPSMNFPVGCSSVDKDVASRFKELTNIYHGVQNDFIQETSDRITEIQKKIEK